MKGKTQMSLADLKEVAAAYAASLSAGLSLQSAFEGKDGWSAACPHRNKEEEKSYLFVGPFFRCTHTLPLKNVWGTELPKKCQIKDCPLVKKK